MSGLAENGRPLNADAEPGWWRAYLRPVHGAPAFQPDDSSSALRCCLLRRSATGKPRDVNRPRGCA